jgi:hypothetical protein
MDSLQPLHNLNVHEDARGKLVSVEGSRDLPFNIERVYYIIPRQGAARGFHAHKSLKQLLICVSGSCHILVDDGVERQDVLLDRPDVGLYNGPMHWLEMREFSPDCVLLVLASAPHEEGDYIRDYNEFIRAVGRAA